MFGESGSQSAGEEAGFTAYTFISDGAGGHRNLQFGGTITRGIQWSSFAQSLRVGGLSDGLGRGNRRIVQGSAGTVFRIGHCISDRTCSPSRAATVNTA